MGGALIRHIHDALRKSVSDERGFALVLAIGLITLIAIVAVTLTVLVYGEDSNSRRDQTQDGAYQAAEAGTNAYLSDLTESNIYWSAYMAEGEATRTDSSGVAHPSNPNADAPWTWGSSWTYATPKASDTGWSNSLNGYQYLIDVYPPNSSLSGIAETLTRIDVTGRPTGSTNLSEWRTIETVLRPSSLSDFQAFLATSITYASGATTTGPIFVGEDKNGNPGSLVHDGIAKANLYAEGTVTVGGSTLQNGARKYDNTTTPTALCKLNNCSPVPFSNFATSITTVAGAAAAGGISLAATDPTNSSLSSQGYDVDAWRLDFQSNGTVLVSSCKDYSTTSRSGTTVYADYDGSTPPVCGTATTMNVPANGAIYAAADVIVDGVVKGRVTVATNGNVVYGGNTTYNANGVDVLGLEADGTIYIAEWAPDSSGNITLWSAQFALNGPWTADPKCGSPTSCHSACRTSSNCVMSFYGSTAVYGQSGSAISMSGMFNTRNYNYDTNLLFVQPPYWPTLGNAFTVVVQRQL
jgi:hypothetical protein